MAVRGSQGSLPFLNMLSSLPMFQPAQSDATSVAAAEEARTRANMPLKLAGRDGGGVQVNIGYADRHSAKSQYSGSSRSYASIFAQRSATQKDKQIAAAQERLAQQGVNLNTLT